VLVDVRSRAFSSPSAHGQQNRYAATSAMSDDSGAELARRANGRFPFLKAVNSRRAFFFIFLAGPRQDALHPGCFFCFVVSHSCSRWLQGILGVTAGFLLGPGFVLGQGRTRPGTHEGTALAFAPKGFHGFSSHQAIATVGGEKFPPLLRRNKKNGKGVVCSGGSSKPSGRSPW